MKGAHTTTHEREMGRGEGYIFFCVCPKVSAIILLDHAVDTTRMPCSVRPHHHQQCPWPITLFDKTPALEDCYLWAAGVLSGDAHWESPQFHLLYEHPNTSKVGTV